MKEFLKKNFLVLLAFILPIALIVVVVLITYLPSLFLSTNYNFLYSSCGDASYSNKCYNYIQNAYSIEDGKLVVNRKVLKKGLENDVADADKNYTARLFLHDTEKNESREITLQEAQGFTFSELLTSPDGGVTVSGSYSKSHGFFIFGGGGSHGYYLMKGSHRSKLNLIGDYGNNYSMSNFQFIGWILEDLN